MKNNRQTLTSSLPMSVFALWGAALFGCFPATATDLMSPTSVTVTNKSSNTVYANLVLGQPPTTMPANCTNLGQQIQSIAAQNLVFTSSIPQKKVAFTPWTPAVTTAGYYELAAGETITYRPQTFKCAKPVCSPAVTFNFFFTPNPYNGHPNNGCGGSPELPNATNLAEASINFAINGSVGSGCANADGADISAVNGINSFLELTLTGASWPFRHAANSGFGKNADRRGVYGWAATGCVNDTGYPNPTSQCAAPNAAPKAPANGQCATPKGIQYPPIVFGETSYCAELSDSSSTYPQGRCVSQRPAGVTGGAVAITFIRFYNPSTATAEKKTVTH